MNSRSFIFISLIVSFTMSAVVSGEQAEKSRHEGARKAARIAGYTAEVLFPLLYLTANNLKIDWSVGRHVAIARYPSLSRGVRRGVFGRIMRPCRRVSGTAWANREVEDGSQPFVNRTYALENISFLGMMAACMGHGLYGLQKELNLDFKRLRDLKTGIKRLVEKW